MIFYNQEGEDTEEFEFPKALTPQNSKTSPQVSKGDKKNKGKNLAKLNLREEEEDETVENKKLPHLKFDLYSTKFGLHPTLDYPVNDFNNIQDIPFDPKLLILKRNSLDKNYYLEMKYDSLIKAISQEMPFSNVPDEALKPWFKILIYSQLDKKDWHVPYFLAKNETLYFDISSFGELDDVEIGHKDDGLDDFNMDLGLPGLDGFDEPEDNQAQGKTKILHFGIVLEGVGRLEADIDPHREKRDSQLERI